MASKMELKWDATNSKYHVEKMIEIWVEDKNLSTEEYKVITAYTKLSDEEAKTALVKKMKAIDLDSFANVERNILSFLAAWKRVHQEKQKFEKSGDGELGKAELSLQHCLALIAVIPARVRPGRVPNSYFAPKRKVEETESKGCEKRQKA